MQVKGVVFPTPVGMNRISKGSKSPNGGVPHASGDEPDCIAERRKVVMCSPRQWG